MQKKQVTEEGFSTSTIYDTKSSEFAREGIFYFIDKIEVYYTSEGILGFFPFYEKREINKRIEKDSFYQEFQKKLYEIKTKLKAKGLELKREITNIGEPINNIKIIYDEKNQEIKSVKFTSKGKVNIYGNLTLFNRRDHTLLIKRNYFITGLKTTYLRTNDGIPYLSYMKCYFAKDDDYLKYYYHNQESNCCTKYCEFLYNIFCFPFMLFDKCFCFTLKLLIFLSKLLFILSLLFGGPVYFYYKTQNIISGEYEISKKNSDYEIINNDLIKIYTDENGFAHIKANNKEDAFFGLGFQHAKNRLWQLDLNRRIAKGTLSEIFGKKTLETDKFMRSLGFNHYSINALKNFRKNSSYQKILDAFVAGINYYANNFKLPVEYYLTFSKFHNFTVQDSIAITTLFSFVMSNDYDFEILYTYLERELGKEFAEKVFNFKDDNFIFANQTIINDEELEELGLKKFSNKKKQKTENNNENNNNNNQNEKKNNNKKEETINLDESILNEKLKNDGASNCYNIEGKYTKSGKPILSNDPHLPNSIPGPLYIAKIYLPDNIISGGTNPGTPIFITGTNSYVSWGLTTENSDNTDFCEEILQGDYYIKDNKNYPLKQVIEKIYIKNEENPIDFEVKYTDNGPIFGKTVPGSFTIFGENFDNSLPLSLRFSPFKHDFNCFELFLKMAFAHKPEDFLPYKNAHIMPNLNIHWASVDGRIGYFVTGILNLKKYKNRFCHGFTSEDDIINEVPREEMLQIISPKKGYIISGNNKPASNNYLYKLSGNYQNTRAYRINNIINEFLKNGTKINVDHVMNINKDMKDANAEYLLPKYLKIVKKNLKQKDQKDSKLIELLSKWNYVMSKDSKEATLFAVLERQLCLNLLAINKKLTNEKNPAVLNYFVYYYFIYDMIEKISNGEKVNMRQCASFNNKSNDCEKYLVQVFSNLKEYIQPFLDSTGDIKKWGEVNFNYYPHAPFDDIPILNKIFSKKIYIGGNRNTVKLCRSPANSKKGPFVGTTSPEIQIITDMSEPDTPYIMMPNGNGGNPFQKFYNNLSGKFENDEMIKFENVNFNSEKNKLRMVVLKKTKGK